MSDRGSRASSIIVPIIAAGIGLASSIGAAWITANARGKDAATEQLRKAVGDIEALKASKQELEAEFNRIKADSGRKVALTFGPVERNNTVRPLLVTLSCNARTESNTLTGFASPEPDTGLSGNNHATSVSGPQRLATVFVVPPGWYYKATVDGPGQTKGCGASGLTF